MSLRNDTIYNLAGSVVSGVASLIATPLLLAKIGVGGFGVLALVWLILGHFTLFDFGLSRATANHIAKCDASMPGERGAVLWTSLGLNLLWGLLGATAVYVVGEPALDALFAADAAAAEQVALALPWLAVAVPIATVGSVLTGALEGCRRFDIANILHSIGSVATQLAPVAIAYGYTSELTALIAATVLTRAFTAIAALLVTAHIIAPGIPRGFRKSLARELLRYGAWISVSSLIVPLLMSLDKFMISSLLGTAAVAYYAVPDQLVRRVSILPISLGRSVFPRLASADRSAADDLSHKSARIIACMVTPVIALLMIVMHEFLALWIDPNFAEMASALGIVLAAGIWVNSLAIVPSTYLQAIGKPHLTARCHLIEVVPHIVILWVSVKFLGIIGAALAMFLVTLLDAALLVAFARMRIWKTAYFWQGAGWIVAAAIAGFIATQSGVTGLLVGLSIVGASAFWAYRTSPELPQMFAALRERMSAS